MLLAKLKFAFLGLATLAVVSTGVGVLAQTGSPAGNDRLQAVERKLDRLLELMGGASRRPRSADSPPVPGPRSHVSRMQRSPRHRPWRRSLRSHQRLPSRPLQAPTRFREQAMMRIPSPFLRRRTLVDESICWNAASASSSAGLMIWNAGPIPIMAGHACQTGPAACTRFPWSDSSPGD